MNPLLMSIKLLMEKVRELPLASLEDLLEAMPASELEEELTTCYNHLVEVKAFFATYSGADWRSNLPAKR